jgi:Ca-activated chloride channel family protein
MVDQTFYDRLGLPPDASPEEIRHAYRQLVLHLHPDTNVNAGDTQLFMDIQTAYEQLSDPRKKAAYDSNLTPQAYPESPLTIKTSYSRPSVTRLSEPQLIYSLIEMSILPDTNLWLSATPLNIVMVVDCSTSMQGIRLDAVKQTSIDLLHKLQPNDIFSLVKFNDFAELLIAPVVVSDLRHAEMKIQLLQAGGGTEIFKGLELGFKQVSTNLSPQRVNHIILITDGRTYGDEDNCKQLAQQAADLGIGISALGIGAEWNDQFLDHLTSSTGGICKFIPDGGDIGGSILDEISRLSSSLTEQLSYQFNIPNYIELCSVYRLQPDASPLEPVSPLVLGCMPRQGIMSLMFEFIITNIPSDQNSLTLASGFINYEIPRHTKKTRYVDRLAFDRKVSAEQVKNLPPTGILNAITFLSLYQMQERARDEMDRGDIYSAAHYMENMATRLLQKGERILAQSVLDEVSHIRNNRSFSEDGEKRIKYGTRSLLLPAGTVK